jgi:hypothetical protein
VSGGIVTKPVGLYMQESASNQTAAICVIPDTGFEIASRFMTMWQKQGIAPEMVLFKLPTTPDHKFFGASIVFKTDYIGWVAQGYEYVVITMIMKNNSGEIVYQTTKGWDGKHHDRSSLSPDEFIANNCKPLIEELNAASQGVAEIFVKEILAQLE